MKRAVNHAPYGIPQCSGQPELASVSEPSIPVVFRFSRAASAAAKPTIGDVKALNKIVRSVRAQPSKLYFWPIKFPTRIIGYPDASYKNNEDGSSQRGQCIFIAEVRREGQSNGYGSMVDYESTKIKRTTLSTTVAELYSFMKCYGTCQFLRGLWMDMCGEASGIHMRTDANNLVTTASTTHSPEQRETIHMIQMLRREACSGSIEDLAHVRTEYCLADCFTKASAKPDALVKAVETGVLPQIDCHPLFRSSIPHKAYSVSTVREKDYWVEEANMLVRVHVVPRRTLFVPDSPPACPVPLGPSVAVSPNFCHVCPFGTVRAA